MSGPGQDVDTSTSANRRISDWKLYESLRATDFRGPVYDCFVARATEYATGTLWKLVESEEVFACLERIGRPRPRPAFWNYHDKEDLVAASVEDGYLDFHDTLARGRWDRSRSSLYTLLVRYCVSRFADHYESWRRRSLDRLAREARKHPDGRAVQYAPSAERVAAAKREVKELSPEQFAKGAGYSYEEIGQMLGISERAVEGRLYRAYRDRRRTPDADTGGGGTQ